MAVFDFEPKDGQLDEPLRSQEIIMLKEVLYVEEPDRATSPVAGLHRSVHQQELVPLPSSFGSFEFQLPANHQEQHLECQERAAPYVELPAKPQHQQRCKRQKLQQSLLFRVPLHLLRT